MQLAEMIHQMNTSQDSATREALAAQVKQLGKCLNLVAEKAASTIKRKLGAFFGKK